MTGFQTCVAGVQKQRSKHCCSCSPSQVRSLAIPVHYVTRKTTFKVADEGTAERVDKVVDELAKQVVH